MSERIKKNFEKKGKKLVTFTTGGDPDFETSIKIIQKIIKNKVDIIEIDESLEIVVSASTCKVPPFNSMSPLSHPSIHNVPPELILAPACRVNWAIGVIGNDCGQDILTETISDIFSLVYVLPKVSIGCSPSGIVTLAINCSAFVVNVELLSK